MIYNDLITDVIEIITDVICCCYRLIISVVITGVIGCITDVITDVIERITDVIRTTSKNGGNHPRGCYLAQLGNVLLEKNHTAIYWNTMTNKIYLK